MKLTFRILLLIAFVSFSSCKSDDGGTPPSTGGDDDGTIPTATYDLTLTTTFTADTHPTDYPSNAMFGPMIAVAHPPDVSVFRIGQAATEAFKAYAEEGDPNALATALTTGVDGMEVTTAVVIRGNAGPSDTESLSINVTPTNTRITFIARLSPSPDWFIGVDSFDIVDGNTLVDMEEFILSPLDAGTDSGATYNSDNNPTTGGVIRIINTPPFGNGGLTPALGTLLIERTN